MRYDPENIASNIEKKRIINKIVMLIITILLIPMVSFSLFLISLELGNSKELPSFLDMNLYIVSSESMEPRLKEDDIIIVKKGYNSNEFKVGNIITYERKDGEVITHRIKQIINSESNVAYITQGDNNEREDEEVVEYSRVIGKVVYTMPKFGKVVKLLKNKVFFTIALVSLIIILLYDRKLMKRKKQRKKIREIYEKKSDFYF